ncbi:helix-turn-helix domain-containing protein [Polaribacter marinivivus]|uniref:Helix-turn-helix domain-containing protein n=1 Tax=Polaribacter marinivivus TaxID=1524260 RepID=A0ABV8RAY8_9FLAO
MKKVDKDRADRVIKVFNDSGLNQRKFAELIGVSQQLVSAVVNYTKKPNETILLAILDNIEGIDPLWLFTGVGKYKDSYVAVQKEVHSPIEEHIKELVRDQFKGLSKKILQRLNNIEEFIKDSEY